MVTREYHLTVHLSRVGSWKFYATFSEATTSTLGGTASKLFSATCVLRSPGGRWREHLLVCGPRNMSREPSATFSGIERQKRCSTTNRGACARLTSGISPRKRLIGHYAIYFLGDRCDGERGRDRGRGRGRGRKRGCHYRTLLFRTIARGK